MKTILKDIEESGYGLFCRISGKDRHVTSGKEVLLERSARKEKEFIELEMLVKNNTHKKINLYSAVVCEFVLEDSCHTKEVLEHGFLQCSFSSYRKPWQHTKRKSIFLIRNQNQNSFEKKYGYMDKSIVSEWFTCIRMKRSSLIIGASTTAKQFSAIYVRKEKDGLRVRVICQFDGIILTPGASIKTERIFFCLGDEQKALNAFADKTAENMNVQYDGRSIRGLCCSYYWNGNNVSEEIVLKDLKTLENLNSKLVDFVQIDAGYFEKWGDWHDYKRKFPSGMKLLVNKIKKKGYKAGIWIAPFTAKKDSKLFRDHIDWIIKDKKNRPMKIGVTESSDLVTGNCLFPVDVTNEEVKKYISKVISSFKKDGFELFKIDFLFSACILNIKQDKITRAQALREGVEMIRKIAGESYIISAISPLSPLVGLVDSARIGIDSGLPHFTSVPVLGTLVNNHLLTEDIRNAEIRMFMNKILWSNDLDCIILKNFVDLNHPLLKKQLRLIKEHKLPLWIGDKLGSLNKKEIELLKSMIRL
ncbi:MAG: glycoside hydrolase family 36 protein [archaeon]